MYVCVCACVCAWVHVCVYVYVCVYNSECEKSLEDISCATKRASKVERILANCKVLRATKHRNSQFNSIDYSLHRLSYLPFLPQVMVPLCFFLIMKQDTMCTYTS